MNSEFRLLSAPRQHRSRSRRFWACILSFLLAAFLTLPSAAIDEDREAASAALLDEAPRVVSLDNIQVRTSNLEQFNVSPLKGIPLLPGDTPTGDSIAFAAKMALAFVRCPLDGAKLQVEAVPSTAPFTGTPSVAGSLSSCIGNRPCEVTTTADLPVTEFDAVPMKWRARHYVQAVLMVCNPRCTCTQNVASSGYTDWVPFSENPAYVNPGLYLLERAIPTKLTADNGSLLSGDIRSLYGLDDNSVRIRASNADPEVAALIVATTTHRKIRSLDITVASKSSRQCQQTIEVQRSDGTWENVDQSRVSRRVSERKNLSINGSVEQYFQGQTFVDRRGIFYFKVKCERATRSFTYELDNVIVTADSLVSP